MITHTMLKACIYLSEVTKMQSKIKTFLKCTKYFKSKLEDKFSK